MLDMHTVMRPAGRHDDSLTVRVQPNAVLVAWLVSNVNDNHSQLIFDCLPMIVWADATVTPAPCGFHGQRTVEHSLAGGGKKGFLAFK
jgi:hypothetical protein